jgi:hypothetical protein
MQCLRDDNISGTSCTIVLCGEFTYGRKYVDWEIKGTLDKQHGLIGVQLPSLPVSPQGKVRVPPRLNENIDSGYADWIHWSVLLSGPDNLKAYIAVARQRSKTLIVNRRELMPKNTAGNSIQPLPPPPKWWRP